MLKTYELSNAQKRIWYTQKKHRESSLFNIGGTVQISGRTDIEILKKSLEKVIDSNEGLHFEFYEDKNEVYSYINPRRLGIEYMDFTLENNSLEVFQQWCREQAGTCFSMIRSPLYKFVIYKLSEELYGYFIMIQHIIADGWSIKLFTDQVANIYDSMVGNTEINNNTTPSYLDYILEEEGYLNSDKGIEDKMFWLDMFSTMPSNTSISSNLLAGKRTTYVVEDTLMSDINVYVKRHRITINGFFTAAYLLYAYKKQGKTDQILGIPLLGRASKKERATFGNFTNTMPYRYQINRNLSINDMMKEVMVGLKKVYQHQRYPYNKLCKKINMHENKIDRLYDVCINYYNTTLSTDINQMEVQNTEFYNGQQEYAMQIILRHWNNVRLQMDFDYQLAVYSDKMITDIYEEFMTLIKKIVKQDTLTVKELNLLEDEEYERVIYEFNKTDITYHPTKTWLNLFRDTALKYSKRIALSKNETGITYEELDTKSDVAAFYFSSFGIKKGDIVAIIPTYDITSIISIVGIMKTGAVYLPIDKKSPSGRIGKILSESDADFLIGYENYTEFEGLFIKLTEDIFNEISPDMEKITPPFVQDTAYIIYTSGSTGMPKGVMVTHKNLMNYLMWAKNTYVKRNKEVFPLYSSFSFDFTITSLFLPLICGGEIRLYENKDGRNIFRDILNDNKATIVKITPSHIALICDTPVINFSLHTIILGGENLKTEVCKKLDRHFNGKTIIYNEYGPTEATVGCMIYQYNASDNVGSVSIGKPISNTQIYILDKDLQPVPKRTLGEMYISGDSVAKGYYNREEETAERFIRNPFVTRGTIYKTGDLAFYKEDGNIYYYGRNDKELKIRGNRVNLSEIERKIMDSGMVADVVVKTVEFSEGRLLCAYLLSETQVHHDNIKRYLYDMLPDYMVPELYVTLKEFPLTVNGKVDSNKLPLPSNEIVPLADIVIDEKLEQLLAIAKEILSKEEKVLPDSNFFLLGGDSIKAIQISSHMYDEGYDLSVNNILENPVFYKMARAIKGKEHFVYEQGICSGEAGKLPITEWFLNQKFKEVGHYNQSILLELKKEISEETFNDIFQYLIKHHDALRINYNKERGVIFYNNEHLKQNNIIRVISLNQEDYEVDIEKTTRQFTNPRFDISKDLLLRPYLIFKGDKSYLLIMAHHLIIDAVSLRILLEDIQKLLSLSKENYNLPRKTASYLEFTRAFHNWSQFKNPCIKEWNLEKDSFLTLISKHEDVDPNFSPVLELELSERISQYLQKEANDAYGTKPNELQLIALALALHDITHKKSFCIQSESHGRNLIEDMNVNRTVGWFTILYPLNLTVYDLPLKKQITTIKDQIRHREKLCFEFGILKYLRRGPLKETASICFNYLGELVEGSNEYYDLRQIFNPADNSPLNQLPYFIDINTVIYQNKLKIYIKYRVDLIDEKTVEKLTKGFQLHLEEIVNHCVNRKEKVVTLEDFDMVNLTYEELDNLLMEGMD